MATRSSTSSSELRATHEGRVEGRFRPPLGLFLALVLVAGVELALRAQLPADDFLVDQVQPHTSIHQALDADGIAEVAFLGASVSWNGLRVPLLDERIDAAAGRDVTVANYSHLGMRAELALDLAEVLARREPAPRVLYFGVTPHSVARSDELDPTAWAWALADWRREVREHGLAAADGLPDALRNELARHLRIVEVRRDPQRYWQRLRSGVAFEPNPMRGGHVLGHVRNPNRTAPRRPGSDAEPGGDGEAVDEAEDELLVRALEDRNVIGGEDAGEGLLEARRIALLEEMVEVLTARGIEVVLFEVPLPAIHVRALSDARMQEFQRAMTEIARSTGARYEPFDTLGIEMGFADFKDSSHMNGRGAERFSRAILRAFVLDDVRRLFRADA